MDSTQIIKAVEILTQNTVLVSDWERLKDHLGLGQIGEFVLLGNQFRNNTITVYKLFSEILTQWTSSKGDEANIQKLIEVLERLGYVNVSRKKQSC